MQEKRGNSCCVTISTQRSGTKLLGNCFNKGTEVLSLGELFHDHSPSPVAFRNFVLRSDDFARKYSVGAIFDLLDIYFSELQGLYPCIHLDVMYNNLAFCSPLWWDQPKSLPLIEYFRSRNFAVIHLLRPVVDCYVSIINAETSGSYHRTADGDVTPSGSESRNHIHLDEAVARFKPFEETVTNFRLLVEAAFEGYAHYCTLNYNEMLDEEEGMLTDDARVRIASVIKNGCSPWDLQHRTVDLVKNVRREFAAEVAAELRKASKPTRKKS